MNVNAALSVSVTSDCASLQELYADRRVNWKQAASNYSSLVPTRLSPSRFISQNHAKGQRLHSFPQRCEFDEL